MVNNSNPPVEVIRSANRTKTASARRVGGKIVVRIPALTEPDKVAGIVESLVAKVLKSERKHNLKNLPNLRQRANEANKLYFGGKLDIKEIKWVTNQERRYGSCTPATQTIRISDRVATMPLWVLDYVLVHELAHLLQPNHSAEFWKLVEAYPRAERARGYLIAVGLEGDDGPREDGDIENPGPGSLYG